MALQHKRHSAPWREDNRTTVPEAGLRGSFTLYAQALAAALCLLCGPSLAAAQGPSGPTQDPTGVTATMEPGDFEVSLSSGHLLPATKIFRYEDNIDLVPTSAVLLLIEPFLTYRWRLRFMYNLRTSTEQRILRDTGEVLEKVSPSTVGAGLTWVPFTIEFRETSRVEFQGGLMLGAVLDDDWSLFPIATGRVHLMQDADAGVGIYLGVIYELLRHQLGPFYGVGYRF